MVKYLMVCVLCLVVLVVLVWPENQVDSQVAYSIPKPQPPAETAPKTQTSEGHANGVELQMTSQAQARYEALYDEIRNEFPPFQHSDDWLIEMHILVNQSAHCYRGLRKKNRKSQLSDGQIKAVEQVQQWCDQRAEKYASFNDKKIVWQRLIRPESEEGEQLQAALDLAKDQDDYLPYLTWAIKNKNHHLLAAAWSNPLSKSAKSDVSQLLQSGHQLYNTETAYIATNWLACQVSDEACSAMSPFMFEQCLLDEVYCGMTFNDWYLNHVPLGQQKDVAILVDWITAGVE